MVLFCFPLFVFLFFSPFLYLFPFYISLALLVLPPTPLSARPSPFSSLSTHLFSSCSDTHRRHRRHSTSSSLSLHLTCATPSPNHVFNHEAPPSSWDIHLRLTCISRSSDSDLLLSFSNILCDSPPFLPIGCSVTSVLSYLHTRSLLIARPPHATVFPLANRLPSPPFSR